MGILPRGVVPRAWPLGDQEFRRATFTDLADLSVEDLHADAFMCEQEVARRVFGRLRTECLVDPLNGEAVDAVGWLRRRILRIAEELRRRRYPIKGAPRA